MSEEDGVEAIDDRVEDPSVAVVALSGELDVADSDWSDDIDAALAAGNTRIVIDLTNVTFVDSSVIRAVVLAYLRVRDEGWVRLVYTHHLIARVIRICGLADTFPQYTTVEAALRSAPSRSAGLRSDAAAVRAVIDLGGDTDAAGPGSSAGERHDSE